PAAPALGYDVIAGCGHGAWAGAGFKHPVTVPASLAAPVGAAESLASLLPCHWSREFRIEKSTLASQESNARLQRKGNALKAQHYDWLARALSPRRVIKLRSHNIHYRKFPIPCSGRDF